MITVVDRDGAHNKSRLALVFMAALTLRCIEIWRNSLGADDDLDCTDTMIVLAVFTIAAEKMTRNHDGVPLDLNEPIPLNQLTKVNVSSIATAIGVNRETTRRRIETLKSKGLLTSEPGGSIVVGRRVVQNPAFRSTVIDQVVKLVRTINALDRANIVNNSAVSRQITS